MRNFMKNSMDMLDKQMKQNSSNLKFNQIVFIISDGRFNKNVKNLFLFFRMLDSIRLKRRKKDICMFLLFWINVGRKIRIRL